MMTGRYLDAVSSNSRIATRLGRFQGDSGVVSQSGVISASQDTEDSRPMHAAML